MKFRDIYNILKEIDFLKLKISRTQISRSGQRYDVLLFNKEQRETLTKVLEIPSLKKEFYTWFYDRILSKNFEEIPYEPALVERIDLIREICMFYKKNFELMYPQLNKYSISIKVPEKYSLKEIGEYFEKLEKCFNPLLYDSRIDGVFELSNFDTGSKWIDVSVKTGKALAVIIALLGGMTSIVSNIQECRLKDLEIEELKMELQEKKDKLKNDKKTINQEEINVKKIDEEIAYLEKFCEIQKRLQENRCRKFAENFYKEHYLVISEDPSDKELIIRITRSVEILSEILIDGAQIRPAIEYKENFDGIDIQKLIAYEEQKQIENKGKNA